MWNPAKYEGLELVSVWAARRAGKTGLGSGSVILRGMTDKKPDNAGMDSELDVPTYDPNNPSRYASGSQPQETRSMELNSDAPTTAASRGGSTKDAARQAASESPLQRPGRAQPQSISPDAGRAKDDTAADVDSADASTTAFPASGMVPPAAGAATGTPAGSSVGAAGAYDKREQQVQSTDQYAAPQAAAAPVVTEEPVETAEEREAREERERLEAEKREGYRTYGKRGTIDFGLLFVRLALSVYLIFAGVTTFFKLGGSDGLAGLESDFANYALPNVLAIGVPTLQLIAGVFLLLGLITPLAAMFGLVVTGFTAIHAIAESGTGLDVFAWPESVWLSLVLFVIAFALQFTGPGFYSLDFGRSWARRPLATSWIFVILGIAALVAVWWIGAADNPLA